MRILHTSDWHLNERLSQVERRADIFSRLLEIAEYLKEYKVDVMVVSGDLFSNITRLDQVGNAVNDIRQAFREFLLRGGTMVAISGNHDNEILFNMVRDTMDLVAPREVTKSTEPLPPGRLYLFERPGYIRLADRAGQVVQFVLLPYPKVHSYLKDEQAAYNSVEEKNRLLRNALVARLDAIRAHHIDPQLPTVQVSHIHVRGNKIHNLYRLSELEDVVFEPGDLRLEWAYVACGHIHLPQLIGKANNARYAGSIERLDFSEAKDEKSVVLVEIGKSGIQSAPVPLPLDATPLYKVIITNPEKDIPALGYRYPEAERAIVDYRLLYRPGEHNLDAIVDEIERIFPRWCRRRIESTSEIVEAGGELRANIEDVPSTVRAFLKKSLENHPDRDDLLVLAEQLLAEEGT